MLETQGKTEKDNINRDQNQEQSQHQIQRIETGALSDTPNFQHSTTNFQVQAKAEACIRTELLAQLSAQIIEQLPSIEALLLHLEGKARAVLFLSPSQCERNQA